MLVLDGYGGAPLPNIDIAFDFYASNKNAIFVDLIRNFSYKIRDPYPGSGKPNDVFPSNFQTWRTGTFTPTVINRTFPVGTPDDQANPPKQAYWRLTPNAGLPAIPAGQSIAFYFEARLAPTFIWWQAGQEYRLNAPPTNALGGDRYGPPVYPTNWTAPHNGASQTSGSSAHFYLESPGIGQKKIPIPIPTEPPGVIQGTKYNDLNASGTREMGEPGLGGWTINLLTTIDGITFPFSITTLVTDGSYAFSNLVAGTYTITEVLQSGWTQTAPTPIPPGSYSIVLGDDDIASVRDFGNMNCTIPDCTITAPASVCAGSTSNTASVPDAGVGATYTWTITNGTITAGQGTRTITWTAGSVSPITIGITVTTSAGCQCTGSKNVTVNAKPIASAASNSPVCEGATINLSGGPALMASYAWYDPNFNLIASTQNHAIPNATLAMAGSYTLIVNDGTCTSDNATTLVTVNAKPIASAASNSPVCEGATINLSGGPALMASYAWYDPNFNLIASTQNHAIPNATLAMAGSYTLIVNDGTCTSDNATTLVTVNAKP
ncbi:MAG: hypothetical protein FJ023_06145, partial [Chloroflexi bacterium]|nr:hypothetical protein [Chloroflexota bacterium]